MATDLIRYDLLVQEALRSVLRKVLADAARDGLPGNHHFVVAFRTDAPGVRIPAKLREKYPQEMTIVLQHEFWNLEVGEQAFEVRLNFDRKPEVLVIPFEAVTGFYDPSVEFGLKFEMAEAAAGTDIAPASRTAPPEKTKPRGSGTEPAEVNPKQGDAATAPKQIAGKPAAALKADEAQDTAPTKVVSIDAFRKK
jgi:uncharacterized protein